MKQAEQLLSLIRLGVFGEGEKVAVNDLDLPKLYALASAQDMAHVVAIALEKMGVSGEDPQFAPFQKAKSVALFRYVQMENALAGLGGLLEEAEIPFVPLKGSVIRHLYPDPTMRTSCDIDVLVPKEQLKKAVSLLEEKGGYNAEPQGTGHDISLYSVDKIHIELHYSLMEMDDRMAEVLDCAWEEAAPVEGKTYGMAFSPEMLMLYHIIHTAKHFGSGGCGIRPILDLYILNQKLTFNREKLESKLAQAGVLTFYGQMCLLAEIWFGTKAAHTPLTQEMEKYIISGGVFGTVENHAKSSLAKHGRAGLFLRRLFPSGAYMKKRYPQAQKCPILLPWFYFWRLLCFLVRADAKDKVKIHFQVAKAGVTEEAKRALWMMEQLEIDQSQLV